MNNAPNLQAARQQVEEIFRHVASDGKLSDEYAYSLVQYPAYDTLRLGVSIDDAARALAVLRNPHWPTKLVGAMLMRGLPRTSEYCEEFVEMWKSAPNAKVRIQELFSATDYPMLAREHHQEMFEYVLSHWADWVNEINAWYPPSKGGPLGGAVERLHNPEFPRSKNWVYLCVAAVDARRADVRKLVEEYCKSEEKMTSQVATTLLDRL